MSLVFFVSWIVIQLFLILYVFHREKRIINAFSLTTLIYLGSYAYPYLYSLGVISTLFNESLFDSYYADDAVIKFFYFKVSFDIIYIFYLLRGKRIAYKNKDYVNYDKYFKFFDYMKISCLYIFVFCLFIIGSGGVDKFFFPEERFDLLYPKVVNFAYILSLLLYFYGLMRHFSYKNNVFFIISSTVFVLLYPMSMSGRAVILPFVMIIIASYFSNRRMKLHSFILLVFLISFFYINSLYARNNALGIIGYINSFYFTYNDVFFIFDYFFSTVSGFATTTVTLSGLKEGVILIEPNFLLFMLYLSPIPSFLLPTSLFVPYQSLTPHFGYSIGINSDIISESLLWFGNIGVFVTGILMGGLCRFVDIKSYQNDLVSKVLFFSYTYLILMSNIASIRASSRFMLYIMTFLFIRWLLIKLSKSIR